jgi:ubiquinone biosynthesis protein
MKKILRLFLILKLIVKYRLDTFVPSKRRTKFLTIYIYFVDLFKKAKSNRAVRLRCFLEDLGPIFIKFGQLLSTRRDLFPEDISDELSLLQDKVNPFDSSISITKIESAFNKSIDDIFCEFENIPLASASVAQVHSAKLYDGKEVVVKIIRPKIREIIENDIALLFNLSKLITFFSSESKRLNLNEVIQDYKKVILDELDLQKEAANYALLKNNFESRSELKELLFIPDVIWELTSKEVMVVERIYGVAISEIDTLKEKEVDLKVLAENGVKIFFTQVFEQNFFHADMHPGNIFVDPTDPKRPRYMGIDCAIMGTLSDFDRYYLARNLLAVFERDYNLVARLHVESGWVAEGTDIQSFEAVIRSACEPIFQKPLSEISFGTLLIYLFQVARDFGMQVQPSLVLLQKTLLNVEGLGRQLYPNLDLWATAHPFLKKWMRKHYSPIRIFKELKNQGPALIEALPLLPDFLLNQLHQKNGTITSGIKKNTSKSDIKNTKVLESLSKIEKKQKIQSIFNTVFFIIGVLSIIGYLNMK